MNDAERSNIESLLLSGKKIEAIKNYRAATGLGLKEAKDAVEQVEQQLISQGRLTKRASGCFTVLVCIVVWIVVKIALF